VNHTVAVVGVVDSVINDGHSNNSDKETMLVGVVVGVVVGQQGWLYVW